MAELPVPRSYSEILGDMIDAFLSRYGLRALKIGSPVLSMLESAAQSDLRSSEDTFTLLEAVSLDQAKGIALERIGNDENVPKQTESPASGTVTVSDTSFTKITSKVFHGLAAPIVGTTTLHVTDATDFPSSGSVYIGRGTNNYEGPIAYTSKTDQGDYWDLALSTGTQRFHNQGETVTVAQGGNRVVNAEVIVRTRQGNVVEAVQFKVVYTATLLDGETEVAGVTVLALKPGTIGNVGKGAIEEFAAAPFSGAAVTNPLPFTNGLATETDDAYRERIRNARQSRARGTALALQTFSIGVTALDENKRVLSASVINRQSEATLLVIDDGTGYEERAAGVALETFADEALGGEQYFKTSLRPVAKAFLLSTESAPFALTSGQQLAIAVGGVVTVHTFNADEFRSIDNASAYEVTASVNGDPSLLWSMRTYNGGTQLVVFAKADTNEDVEYSPLDPVNGVIVDANTALGFPSNRVDTMRLYLDDRLLSKDGRIASVTSNGVALWGALSDPETLALSVDGTPLSNLAGGVYTFTDDDFVDAETGFTTLGINTPAAWAKVFNARIAGVTATVVNGLIVLTSNRDRSDDASLEITGGTLVTKGMFSYPAGQTILESFGAGSDYTLNRNTGEFKLTDPLAEGSKLTAGSPNTRAFLQSGEIEPVTLATTGRLWFAVDGAAHVVPHGLTASTPVNWSSTVESWGRRVRITQVSGTGMFSNVVVGDWLTFWSAVAPGAVANRSVRISAIVANGSWVEFDWPTAIAPGNPFTFTDAGITFSRTDALLQRTDVPAAASYTAASFQPYIDVLTGATATVYRTDALRVYTNTFEAAGSDIALVAANAEGEKVEIETGDAVDSLTGHLASVEAVNDDSGTPDFRDVAVTDVLTTTSVEVSWTDDGVILAPPADSMLVTLRPFPDGTTLALTRYGNSRRLVSSFGSVTDNGGGLFEFDDLRNPPENDELVGDRYYIARPYALTYSDELGVLVDEDIETKRFIVPMARTLDTVGSTYGTTNTFKDADNGGASLAVAFGFGSDGFDFDDFAVFMPARVKTHSNGDATHYAVPPADSTRTILWRFYRLGLEGNYARVRYALPLAEDTAVSLETELDGSGDYPLGVYNRDRTSITIRLGSGALKTGYALTASHKIGRVVTAVNDDVASVSILLGLASTTAQRTGNVTTITVDVAAVGATNHGFQTGDSVFVKNNNATYPDGYYAITGVTATTFDYADVNPNAGPDAISGTVSFGSTEATLTGASPAVVVGDYFRREVGVSTIFVNPAQTLRIESIPNPQGFTGVWNTDLFTVDTVVAWETVGDLANFKIFAATNQTASAIRTAVNALGGVLTGALIGNGTGVINQASYAEAGGSTNQWFQMTDGINFVKATTVPGTVLGDYQLEFKDPVSADLVTDSDWANETVKVVPRTTKNVVDWLNVLAVSGLSSVAAVERSSRGSKPQIASYTMGSDGSVEVQGGGANSSTLPVVGAARLPSGGGNDRSIVTVPTAGTEEFLASGWFRFDNTEKLPQPGIFTSVTVLNNIAASGLNWLLTFAAGTDTYTVAGSGTLHGLFNVERQGDFVALTNTGLGAAVTWGTTGEGDWIRFVRPASPTYFGVGGNEAVTEFSSGNVGIFRVIRHQGNTVWIENSAAVEQALTELQFTVYDAASIMPGDTLHVSTPLWDGATSNQGVFTVVEVDNGGSGVFTNAQKLTISGNLSAVGSPAAALGTSANLVQIVEGKVDRFYKQLYAVAPFPDDADLTDLKFTTSRMFDRIGAAAGSVVTALDKLAFPTDVSKGIDGYHYNTGLIAEVSRVIYGDPSDTATYPGVAAAGANVNIQGPLVKRVQVTLAIRLRAGAPEDVSDRVKSAVASVINKAGVGQAIALSDLTTAAGKVGGVLSVVMVSPVATTGNDLISVQPFEKPLVLNVDQDVLVTFVGD